MAIHLKKGENLIAYTERSIQKKLVRRYRNGVKYMVMNMHYVLGEMDFFMLRRNGYAEEFEIKISTSDFRVDSKKVRKHETLQRPDSFGFNAKYPTPNKFSYVLGPDVKYELSHIPKLYGVYVVNGSGCLVCKRTPKFLHKVKYDWVKKIAGSCSWRLLDLHMKQHS